jgi:hypothetical protein
MVGGGVFHRSGIGHDLVLLGQDFLELDARFGGSMDL